MPIRRGTVCGFSGGRAGTVGFLVLTNDDWNESMEDVAVVPLQPLDATRSPRLEPVIDIGRPLRVIAGRLLNWSKDELGPALYVLNEGQMDQVEDILVDVLSMEDLFASPPRQPPSPPGTTDYPRWGEIYYAGDRIGGDRKRYVVVSNDHWNRETRTAVAVRTTSRQRRGGIFFPSIQGGIARACCGNVTTFPSGAFEMRASGRPLPHRLSLQDMVAIAEGLVDALFLDRTLRRRFP